MKNSSDMRVMGLLGALKGVGLDQVKAARNIEGFKVVIEDTDTGFVDSIQGTAVADVVADAQRLCNETALDDETIMAFEDDGELEEATAVASIGKRVLEAVEYWADSLSA